MPDSWIALSDHAAPIGDVDPADILPRGSLVLEMSMPVTGPVVLLDHTQIGARSGREIGLSLFHDPVRGLILLQRQGKRLLRHILPDALEAQNGLARMIYQWDALMRCWSLSVDMLDGRPPRVTTGSDPMVWTMADLVGLCASGLRHPAVLWFGVTMRADMPAPQPWIGQRTPIDTPRGPVPAGLLRAGDLVSTLDAGPRPLRAVHTLQVPGRGAFAPVLLRAPYFGQTQDLLVSSEQAIGLQGTSVEYLYGEDRVLAAAGHMADGIAAFVDNRRAVLSGVTLDFGTSALMTADGCILMARADPDSALPARLLHRFEVTPLLAMQARSGLRPVA